MTCNLLKYKQVPNLIENSGITQRIGMFYAHFYIQHQYVGGFAPLSYQRLAGKKLQKSGEVIFMTKRFLAVCLTCLFIFSTAFLAAPTAGNAAPNVFLNRPGEVSGPFKFMFEIIDVAGLGNINFDTFKIYLNGQEVADLDTMIALYEVGYWYLSQLGVSHLQGTFPSVELPPGTWEIRVSVADVSGATGSDACTVVVR